jgi:hypothetical protein
VPRGRKRKNLHQGVKKTKDYCHFAPQNGIYNSIFTSQRSSKQAKRDDALVLCAGRLSYKPAETLRVSLIKDREYLFTFLRHPGVQPTNNQAEQSIRFLVIFRKIMFGTRSQSGLRTHGILPGLLLTALRQGRNPRAFPQTLLTSVTAQAQAALY